MPPDGSAIERMKVPKPDGSPSRPTAIDLFCGAGGLSLGLQLAGFQVLAAIDNDPVAVRTYERALGSHVECRDLQGLNGQEILRKVGLAVGECTLLAGGPPCQGFSVQRRGDRQDPRNDLVFDFIRIVEEIKPRFFIMENVGGLLSKRGKDFLQKISTRASRANYTIQVKLLDAVEYGVPQVRKRAFLVGERSVDPFPCFHFPQPTHLDNAVTVRKAIGDLESPPSDGSHHPRIANHFREARLSALNLERIRHVPPGGGRESLPDHLQLACHVNNPSHRHLDVYGRLSWEQPSVTLTARFDSFTRGRFGHPEEDRSLTIREGARIQTFPDWFVFEGNREQCARQVGNAVPPLLAQKIANEVLATMETYAES